MKIRIGFVSNSSSSSFCIIGKDFELDKIYKKFNIKTDDELENMFSEFGLGSQIDSDNNLCYIGISIENLDENKTIKQLKEDILKKFKDAGFKLKLKDIDFLKYEIYY